MNSSIKKILFPTDFSDNANNALPFALAIAKKNNATLHILHSIEEPYDFAPMNEEIKEGVSGKVRKLFAEMTEEISNNKRYSDLKIQTHIQTGRSTYAILEEARAFDIDLIVMGTKGRSGLQKWLFGSTTAEIIEHSEFPIMAIPQKADYKGFDHILFASDYREADLEILGSVTELADIFSSQITVFHSYMDYDLKSEIMFRGFRELINEQISYDNIDFEEAKSISLFEAVAEKVEHQDISLLVMVSYEEPSALLPNKQTKEMSFYIEAPLLVVPAWTSDK